MPPSTRTAARTEYPVRRPLKRPPVHPGELMREILDDHVNLTIAEAARRMRVSRPALYGVLNGTAAVTADMALRFGQLTGGAPELYLNMQTGYDLEKARQRLADELAEISSERVAQLGRPPSAAPEAPPRPKVTSRRPARSRAAQGGRGGKSL